MCVFNATAICRIQGWCCAARMSSIWQSNSSNLISAMNGSDATRAEMRFELLDCRTDDIQAVQYGVVQQLCSTNPLLLFVTPILHDDVFNATIICNKLLENPFSLRSLAPKHKSKPLNCGSLQNLIQSFGTTLLGTPSKPKKTQHSIKHYSHSTTKEKVRNPHTHKIIIT